MVNYHGGSPPPLPQSLPHYEEVVTEILGITLPLCLGRISSDLLHDDVYICIQAAARVIEEDLQVIAR